MKLPGLSFNKDAVLGWLLRHGEKVVVAVAALGALGLVWGGIDAIRSRSVPASSTPQAIRKLAEDAGRNILAAKPPAAQRLDGQLVLAIDPWRPERVKIAPGGSGMPFDRPLFQQLAKRSVPDVFPIEDLHASAGIAVLAADIVDKPPPAGGRVPEPTPEPPRPGRPRPGGPRQPGDPASPFGATQPALPSAEIGRPQPGKIVPYVVVTGKIPVAKQRAEFSKRFGQAGFQDPKRDSPRWDAWRIERAVVVPGGSDRWEKMSAKNVVVADRGPELGAGPAEARAAAGDDLPAAFLLATAESGVRYAEPLPARIDEPWGTTGLHPWFVPKLQKLREESALSGRDQSGTTEKVGLQALADAAQDYVSRTVSLDDVVIRGGLVRLPGTGLSRVVVESKAGKEFTTTTIGTDQKLAFAVSDAFGARLVESLPAGEKKPCTMVVRLDMMGKTPVGRILSVVMRSDDGGEQEETENNPAVVTMSADGSIQTGAPASGAPQKSQTANFEYSLFRFIDTTVKPGQRYRYRVRLSVHNPNLDLDAEHLADVSAAEAPLLTSKESNATDAVLVPDPTAVLVRLLKKADSVPKRPRFEILVLAADKSSGNYAIRSLVTDVGGLANIDKKLNKPGDARVRGDDVSTDRIVVDMRGQQEERVEPKPGAKPLLPSEPPEVLLLRPDGTFEFTSAADSAPRVERYIVTLPAPEERKSGTRTPSGPGAAQPGGPFGFPGTNPQPQ